MDDRTEADNKIDDVMLPGFRFHPTDEELVGFYLRRKVQQRTLPIELIKQVDIYKYDPWDLPKLAATGEKEWYFYCPRDRKYRNSSRPNRVTGAGFWKATGTDRPIYSSDGTKCIGLKKSLVFYRGRAAKGMKTDWMMHEFRLPSTSEAGPPKKLLDKNFPPADSWAICRIFKKINSVAQRALTQNWMTPFPETGSPDMFPQGAIYDRFHSESVSCTTETGSSIQLCRPQHSQDVSTLDFPTLNIPSYRSMCASVSRPASFASFGDLSSNFMFSSPDVPETTTKCPFDIASMLFNSSPGMTADVSNKTLGSLDFEGPEQQLESFSVNSSHEMQGKERDMTSNQNAADTGEGQWGNIRSIGFPFTLPSSALSDPLKQPNSPWDSPPCPSEVSTTYSPDKCYA